MMGPTHRMAGALAGIMVSATQGLPWSMVAMSGLVASATAHGWASPDIDQTAPWGHVRRWARSIGFKYLARLMAHRFLSHWWGLPVAWWVWIQWLPDQAVWPATMLMVGWASHLVGDFIFGAIPLLPTGRPAVGLGINTGGFWETGTVKLRDRKVQVIPFGPTRVAIGAAICWCLFRAV